MSTHQEAVIAIHQQEFSSIFKKTSWFAHCRENIKKTEQTLWRISNVDTTLERHVTDGLVFGQSALMCARVSVPGSRFFQAQRQGRRTPQCLPEAGRSLLWSKFSCWTSCPSSQARRVLTPSPSSLWRQRRRGSPPRSHGPMREGSFPPDHESSSCPMASEVSPCLRKRTSETWASLAVRRREDG